MLKTITEEYRELQQELHQLWGRFPAVCPFGGEPFQAAECREYFRLWSR